MFSVLEARLRGTSKSRRLALLALCSLCCLALLCGSHGVIWAQEPVPEAEAVTLQALDPGLPSPAQVAQQLAQLKQDPNLPGSQKHKTLRFKPSEQDKPKPEPKQPPSPFWAWLADMASWLAETARFAVWLLGALGVALFLVGVRYWVKVRGDMAAPQRGAPPSHVRDLDIRPDSLPDLIGPAALALWQQGQHRAALSLLYRGALSRLVHVHGVPVTAASTEGDCLLLAARHASGPAHHCLARLVPVWRTSVYGGRTPLDADMQALCADIDAAMAPLAPTANEASVANEAKP